MARSLELPRKPSVRSRAYWLRLLRFFLVALLVALFAVPFCLGVVSMWGLTRVPCAPGGIPDDLPYEDVSFPAPNGVTQQGYFFPGTNGATIIQIPAYNLGRGAELHYVRVFHNAGFNVLTFNSRVCTPQGWMSLGYQEVEDVQAAYEYLKTRDEVDPARVGLHGFSSAGSTGLMALARLPELRSASAEGGYHDYADLLGLGGSATYFDTLYQLGAALAYRVFTGAEIENLSPYDTIGTIGPRAVLLVYGSREVTLPGARLMLERALQNGVQAELWVVEGAGHGDYLSVAPDEFVRQVVGFHQAALLSEESE
ncbi:MAG: prolyl oligopeptidase family serine peptidase [Chloroflexi bacterium]|nr:prolyl oligopeptidase family serine peptidase [Chloroflexota bacterium]